MQRRAVIALAAASAFAGSARAQGAYPDKPITMVVPAPPGGGTDLVTRMYADLLGQELGQQVIVDNKGGGNGNIGTALVARAKPDGYTLLMQYSAYHSANPALIKDLNWKPDDFVGVAMGAVAPHVIVIAKKVPAEDLKSFIAYAKANKGKLNYASVGAGSVPHLGGVLLNKAAGIDRGRLEGWARKVGWEVLLNRAGTTFRKLPDKDKEGLSEAKAIALMMAQPSMIKRPVLEAGGKLLVGFKPDQYETLA